nr:LuxR C-terminal-related transcriptional regulator [uncultured Actinotalea sp.]
MTVQHVRTAPGTGSATGLRPGTPSPAAPAVTRRPPVGAPVRRPARAPLCLVVPELGEGDGTVLLRTLRRRESTHAVLLTRKAGRRELVALLGGGVRGAITAETPGAVRIVGRAPAPARTGPELTARELGVLELVSEGRTNREIGEALQLSALTVKSHLARISRKVGTGDRAGMVAFALRNGLLR